MMIQADLDKHIDISMREGVTDNINPESQSPTGVCTDGARRLHNTRRQQRMQKTVSSRGCVCFDKHPLFLPLQLVQGGYITRDGANSSYKGVDIIPEWYSCEFPFLS